MAKAKTNGTTAKTKTCPVTRSQFRKGAKPMKAQLGDQPLALMTKEFASGTFGWFTNGQSVVDIDGVPCKVTFQVQVFVANSKDAAE